MAKKQIHELTALGRNMTDTDVIAVDTGTATRKAIPSQIKAGVIRDNNNGQNMIARYSGDYLAPAEGRTVYIAGMQLNENNTPVIATIAPNTVKSLLGVSSVTSEVIDQGDLTIGNNGYVQLSGPSSSALFAIATYWYSMPGTKTAIAIVGSGTTWYLTGTPGATVTQLKVRYFFIG